MGKQVKKNEEEIKKESKLSFLMSERFRSACALFVYGVMFLILILAIRESNARKANRVVDPKEVINENVVTSKVEGFSPIKSKNYKFNYTITIDGKKYSYVGIRYGDKQQFTLSDGINKQDFYIVDDIALVLENKKYILSDIPYYYINYFDTVVLERILLSSTYDEEKDIYTIPNKYLDIIVNNKENSTDETLNKVAISLRNKKINEVELDLTNYVKSRMVNVKSVVVNLEFFEFNSVKEFKIGK